MLLNREYDSRWIVLFVSFVVWSLNMVAKSCEKLFWSNDDQTNSVSFAVCKRGIGTRIIFSNGNLIVWCLQYVYLPLKGVGYPAVIVFMMCGFFVSFLFCQFIPL